MNRTQEKKPVALPSALDRLDEIIERAEGKQLALFLDYDGTLTPIVSRPEQAMLSDSMRKAVKQLSDEVLVGVISGRALDDVRRHVDLPGLAYAGDHGFVMIDPQGKPLDFEPAKEFLADVEQAAEELRQALASIAGGVVERKDFSLAVHYRNVAEDDMARLRKAVEKVQARHPRLRFSGGKKIYDVKPAMDWDKGRALKRILGALKLEGDKTLPVYIGDDTTDEDAFRAIKGRGVAILVAENPGETEADYMLLDPAEVEHFLGRLLDMLREKRAPEGPEALGSKAGARDAGEWVLVYDGCRPVQEGLREALTALGNGYFVTRGACFWASDDGTHYPGTYLAGGYNRLASEIKGKTLINEDLVNMPNWLHLSFRHADGEWFSPSPEDLSGYRYSLDLRRGTSERVFTWMDAEGRRTKVVERRLVHMRHRHVAAQCVTLTPLNWSGELEVRTALDGGVTNNGVARYGELNGKHLEVLESGAVDRETVWLKVRTVQSRLEVAMAMRTRAFLGADASRNTARRLECRMIGENSLVGQRFPLHLEQGQATHVEKVVTLYTSRDRAISEPGLAAREFIARVDDFEALLVDHAMIWDQIWNSFDIRFKLKEDDRDRFQMILHLYTFHLLQTCSPNVRGQDVGVPSRGWHGEAYRGHIFWDELFIFPLLNFRIPEITRSLLMYRYRRLREARAMAKAEGFDGAMYPWQSGSDGREESQRLHLNPKSSQWGPDNSRLQRHVNAAIAFNISQYHQVTGDLEFMAFYGLEMLLEIARFFASICEWNEELERYEIKGVMGPDEYHEGYPWRNEPGLDNNFYTNFMAAWTLDETLRILEMMSEDVSSTVRRRVYLHDEEIRRWERITERMRLVFLDGPNQEARGIPAQFEHWDRLEELDWQGLRARHEDIQRLDRILKAENDTPNRYKASKQADVLMLFYLFSREELERMFSQLGYPFDPAMIPRTIEYYLARTSHGSTLSFVVHARVLSRLDRRQSWRLFCDALKSDLEDIQGGTTAEGIHAGAMAGAVDIIQRGYMDLEMRGDVLWFNPRIPEPMERMKTQIRFRGHSLELEVTENLLTVTACRTAMQPIRIGYRSRVYTLQSGDSRRIKLVKS